MTMNILTKDTILLQCSCNDIYQKFLGLNEFPKNNISSPFSEDKKASFKLYPNGTFKCHSTGKQGDVFQFVAFLKNLDCKTQFTEVLQLTAKEMNITSIVDFNEKSTTKSKESISVATEVATNKLTVVSRSFTELDLRYWEQLGVNQSILEKYNLQSISSYCWSNKKPIYTKKECVAFTFELNKNFKLYIPNQEDRGIKKNVLPPFPTGIFGLEQLGVEKKDFIIICEGEKDVLVATSRGFNAVTFGSGSVSIKKENIQHLQSCCNKLFVCYDADETGIKGMQKLIENNPDIIPLYLPKNENIKGYDITDYFQGHTPADFQKLIDLAEKNKSVATIEDLDYLEYDFPKEILEPEKHILDVKKYKLFIANNQIWTINGDGKKAKFNSISNFKIEILQHIQDEKIAMKLIKIVNIHGKECVFDTPSDRMNSLQKFIDMISEFGNYVFTGNNKDFQCLRVFLFDKMKSGHKIDCLGWNRENNFWVWNNKIKIPNKEEIIIDDNGLFTFNGKSFYVPSANHIYKQNKNKYEPQKKFTSFDATISLSDYLLKMFTVFGENSMIAILFSFSSIFQDIIEEDGGFPILFLQGQTSSGKDQLAKCCQSFLGDQQTAINIESGVSTAKAHIREFAQFSNSICQFSEYNNGDRQLDGILKGIWDRNGYKRGTIESSVATDSVPILSSLILTSNYFPEEPALVSRLLWIELNKNEFTDDEKARYNDLKDITSQGISSYTNQIVEFRNDFSKEFKHLKRENKVKIDNIFNKKSAKMPSRISENFSIIIATFEILARKIKFPFNYEKLFDFSLKVIDSQLNKIDSTSLSNKWWNCFLVAIKITNENRLYFEQDIRIDGNFLYFNARNTYSKIQRQWYSQYKNFIPSSNIILETLKRDNAFVETKKSIRIGNSNTSAYVFDIEKLEIKDDLINTVDFVNNKTIPTNPTFQQINQTY